MNTNNKVKLNSFVPLLGPITLGSTGRSLKVCGVSDIIRTSCQITTKAIRNQAISNLQAFDNFTHTHTVHVALSLNTAISHCNNYL